MLPARPQWQSYVLLVNILHVAITTRVTPRFIGGYIIGGKLIVYKDHFEIETRRGNSAFPPALPYFSMHGDILNKVGEIFNKMHYLFYSILVKVQLKYNHSGSDFLIGCL